MPTERFSTVALLLAAAAGISLLLAGCGSSAPTAESGTLPDLFPNHSVEQIRDAIAPSSDTLHTFSARARITVRSPQERQSFNATVRQRRSDSLFMRFSMLGFEGGRMLLTADSLFFFDTRKAVLRVGSVEEVRNIFPAPIGSNELFQNMLGLVAPAPDAQWTLEADSSLYYLAGGNHRREYVVDPTRWRVVRYLKERDDGTVLQERHFSDFRRVDNILIPHQIVFRRPVDGLSAVMTYRDVRLNPSGLSFDLDVPPQVPRRPFQ